MKKMSNKFENELPPTQKNKFIQVAKIQKNYIRLLKNNSIQNVFFRLFSKISPKKDIYFKYIFIKTDKMKYNKETNFIPRSIFIKYSFPILS